MECWWCYWGWPEQIAAIYDRAMKDLKHLEDTEWDVNKKGAYSALHFGPAHVVWEDENWDCAKWCIEECKDHEKYEISKGQAAVIRRSLEELEAVPEEFKCEWVTDENDPDNPAKNPPPAHWKMVKK